jgi:3-oxoacyl-[acyl-carrier protein] reductase
MLLQNEVAIVTGGGRGIGRAIALRFAAEGGSVAVSARTRAELDKTAAEIHAAGGRAIAVPADVSREADCHALVHAVQETFGNITILVNNAGILGPVCPVQDISAHEWDEVLAVNLRGAFQMSKLVIPQMYAAKKGCILNVTSIAGKAAFGLNAPYAASKAALAGFTRTLAAEGAVHGVRVNAISPGPVPETLLSQELGKSLAARFGSTPEQVMETALKSILQGRAQTTGEIAAVALFLVSDQASAITGQTVNVDGGMAFY